MIDIAIIQFPGSNTERETFMACERVGLNPVEVLWNNPIEQLSNFDGYIIVGGFSYEDRSRAGVLASLDPIINQLKIESKSAKPILGICNGAQILVESGLVPGLNNFKLGLALTDNKRIQGGQVVGVGYYNTWSNLKLDVQGDRCAFTRHLEQGEFINIPLAHGEGRFVIPDSLLKEITTNKQTVFRYCNDTGSVIDEFPTNPNGSIYNLAAVCNTTGNVMAIMPHPERTKNGDVIFSSMKEYIELDNPTHDCILNYNESLTKLAQYNGNNNDEWVVDMIINDNEAASIQNALVQMGHDVEISRHTHWEINIQGPKSKILSKIDKSGELYNSNKEYISNIKKTSKTASFLIRQIDDVFGRLKLESLKNTFEINEISDLKYGVIWNIKVNSGNFDSTLNSILETNILFNPLSYECYRIR